MAESSAARRAVFLFLYRKKIIAEKEFKKNKYYFPMKILHSKDGDLIIN
jgi:hypothetical protein